MSKITYSPSVDALAIHLREAEVDDTEEVEPGIMLDYDKDGKVVGIEILDFVLRVRESGVAMDEYVSDHLSAVPENLRASA
jgi:uncharacterized protein YuzE